jgi:hypothetical protein
VEIDGGHWCIERREMKVDYSILDVSALMYYNTSELPSSPRFNLKRRREQKAFLLNLNRSVFEKSKITVHLIVILLDNKTWLVDFEEPLKRIFGNNREE